MLSDSVLLLVSGGMITLFSLILYIPFLRNLFCLSVCHPSNLLFFTPAGAVSIIWFEAFKFSEYTIMLIPHDLLSRVRQSIRVV